MSEKRKNGFDDEIKKKNEKLISFDENQNELICEMDETMKSPTTVNDEKKELDEKTKHINQMLINKNNLKRSHSISVIRKISPMTTTFKPIYNQGKLNYKRTKTFQRNNNNALANAIRCRSKSFVQIRPLITPKAPENYTQYLIDDHSNSIQTLSTAAATTTSSIDDNQVSLNDNNDYSLYYQNDFEMALKDAKFEHLMNKYDRFKLIELCLNRENHLTMLQEKLTSLNSTMKILSLRNELEKLKLQFNELKAKNDQLNLQVNK